MGETIRGTDARKGTPYLLDGQQILIIDRESMMTDAHLMELLGISNTICREYFPQLHFEERMF